MKITDKKIIIGCLGDSLTDGFPAYSTYYNDGENSQSNYQFRIQQLIKQDYETELLRHGLEVIFLSKGICGETTEQIARRLYPEIIYPIQEKFERKPDLVIIVGGTNDLGWGINPEYIEKNIAQMHTICKNEGVSTVGATIPPSRFENDPTYNNSKTSCNGKLAKFFKEEKIPFADLYNLMQTAPGDENLNPLFDAGDGLHFSVAGYHRMGEVIYEESLRVLLKKFLENN